jgi:hypothetical protein
VTFRQELELALVNSMKMTEEDARKTVSRYESDGASTTMRGILGKDTSGYPDAVLVSSWLVVRKLAMAWAKEPKSGE